MKKFNLKLYFIPLLLLGLISFSCTGVIDAFKNVQRLKFKLGNVSNMNVAGIGISNKTGIKDFNILDGAKILSAFAGGKLDIGFTLNVLAKNPNDGTGGTPNTSAVIKNLAWRLFIDEGELINGNIGGIEVPGVGQETTIPINMAFDLLQFFKNDGYDRIMNLIFAIGGKNGSTSKVKLVVKPTVDTFLGPITYPGDITVIDKEFR